MTTSREAPFHAERHGSAPAVVELSGELDLDGAPELREVVAGLVAEGEHAVVLDAAGLEFVDSSGLSALIASHKALEEAGGTMQVRAAAGQVLRVLQIAGLVEYLNVETAE